MSAMSYNLGTTLVNGVEVRFLKPRPNISVNDVMREERCRPLRRRDDPAEHTIILVVTDGAGHRYYGVEAYGATETRR